MVKRVVKKIRPGKGFAHFFHLSLVAILPILVYVFVRLEFFTVALAIILLSKWRMFAVRPRHWLAHIRTNAVDIIVGLSLLSFMIASDTMAMQLLWLGLYELWVLYIKPGSSTILIALQALLAQFAGLVAVFLSFEQASSSVYILSAVAIAYFSARHFFAVFEEEHALTFAWLWGFFAGCLIWILSHFIIFYGVIAQPALLLSVIGYGLAGLYYLGETDKLSVMVRRQIMFVVLAIVIVSVAMSVIRTPIIR